MLFLHEGLLLLGPIIHFQVPQVQERTNSTPYPEVLALSEDLLN